MKFVYDGKYADFRGWVFANGRPVDVTDRATIEALLIKPGFRKVVDDGTQENKAPAAPRVLNRPTLHVRRK